MVATASAAPATGSLAPAAAGPSATDQLLVDLWSQDLPREHGFEPLVVEGSIPPELRGTVYCNGPGLFGQFGRRYAHPFEGDGAITAVRLGGGRAEGASRITQSAGLVEERAAGRMKYGLGVSWLRRMRNVFGGRQKNTANTSVVLWQGRLFALMEAARPTEIDPADLRTIGETDLGGVVGAMFSAHPHRVESRRAIYNFGLEYGRVTKLHLYELPDAGGARHLGAIPLAGPPMLHDFIATDTHLVFFVSPTRVHLPSVMLQRGTFTEMFRWKPEHGTEVICVPIDRPDQPVRFTTDAFYQWHFANASSRGNELVVDYVRYPDFTSFYDIGRLASAAGPGALVEGRPHRAVIDLAAKTLRSEQLVDRNAEFPTISPGREGGEHGVTYFALDELGAIGRLDARTGALAEHALPAGQRATEPLFVPRPGATREDDGHVLTLCHDGASRRAFLAIYDAARLPDGPVATAWFDHHVPVTFHGRFAPG
jgi:all-trans-8'-apo-beta-carotenal 15,15'-oxygenase